MRRKGIWREQKAGGLKSVITVKTVGRLVMGQAPIKQMLVSLVPSNKETFHREKKADKLARSQEAKKLRSQEAQEAIAGIKDLGFGFWCVKRKAIQGRRF